MIPPLHAHDNALGARGKLESCFEPRFAFSFFVIWRYRSALLKQAVNSQRSPPQTSRSREVSSSPTDALSASHQQISQVSKS